MAAYMWNGLQPVTSFTLIPNPNPSPNHMQVTGELEGRTTLMSRIEAELAKERATRQHTTTTTTTATAAVATAAVAATYYCCA